MIKVRNGSECLADPKGEAMAFFDCRPFLRAAPELRQRRQPDPRRQEIPCMPVRFGHASGLAPRDAAVLDELDQLQNVATHAAAVAEPTLPVEPDVQRPVRLTAMVGAVAE